MRVVIIGAGLTGLTTAWLLQQAGTEATVLEARNRLGGRIHTLYVKNGPSVEMGATWFTQKHTHLVRLLHELGIPFFAQHTDAMAIYDPGQGQAAQLFQVPPNEEPTCRVSGGSAALIQQLANKLPQNKVLLGQQVQRIDLQHSTAVVATQGHIFEADYVVSTLPPKLLAAAIHVEPALPDKLLAVAHTTHTWMGESIKAAVQYDQPFWRHPNSSGTFFSQSGPVVELYDHSTEAATHYALKGFINDQYHPATRAEREQLVLQQLSKCYGGQAMNHLGYYETVWRKEPFTFTPYERAVVPHQHNGHELYRQPYMNGRLIVAGSETAAHFPGYMSGAVASAHHAAFQLLNTAESQNSK